MGIFGRELYQVGTFPYTSNKEHKVLLEMVNYIENLNDLSNKDDCWYK